MMGKNYSLRLLKAFAAGAVCIAGLVSVSPVYAQDDGAPALHSDSGNIFKNAFNYVAHNTYVKFGGAYLDYVGDSSELKVQNATGAAAAALGPGTVKLKNTGSSLGDKAFPGGTLGIYLPYTDHHLAVAATISGPIKVDFQVDRRAAKESLGPTVPRGDPNGIQTGVPAVGKTIGQLKTLPPNFSLVYRPWTHTRFQPFIGVGAMYLYTYDTDINNSVLNSVNEPTLYLDKPVACTAKLGFDVYITEKVFLSAEARYAGCTTVKAKLNNIKLRTDLPGGLSQADVGTVSSKNHFRAVIYQATMGVRF